MEQNQDNLIRELVTQMDKAEEVVNEITKVLNDTFKKLTDEADKTWQEKLKEIKSRRKVEFASA